MPGLQALFTRMDCVCGLLERCNAHAASNRLRMEMRRANGPADLTAIIERYEEMAASAAARHLNPPDPLPLEQIQ